MQKCPTVESGQAGRAESCKNCPNAKICQSAKPDEDIAIIKENLKPINYIVVIASGKGGVGKSTITRNIAASAAQLKIKTVILDFDLSGPSIPRLTATSDSLIFSQERFDPVRLDDYLSVISIGHLAEFCDSSTVFNTGTKNRVIKKILKFCNFSDFELMVIDTPPNITEEHLALVNYIKPHGSIIVTTPQNLSLNDAVRQISFCKKAGIEVLGIVENMKDFVCQKCGFNNEIFKGSRTESLCIEEDISYLGSVPLKNTIAKNSDSGLATNLAVFDNVALTIQKKMIEKVTQQE